MKKKILIIISLVFLFSLIMSCYYDKKSEIYPIINTGGCDTTNVTYSGSVKPILDGYCNNCHSSAAASGGVVLDNYDAAVIPALNGKLMGTVKHSSGFNAMPPGTQLDDCKIATLNKWVQSGAPNN